MGCLLEQSWQDGDGLYGVRRPRGEREQAKREGKNDKEEVKERTEVEPTARRVPSVRTSLRHDPYMTSLQPLSSPAYLLAWRPRVPWLGIRHVWMCNKTVFPPQPLWRVFLTLVLQTTMASAARLCSTDRTRMARESKPWCDSESLSLGTQRLVCVCVCVSVFFGVGCPNRLTNENVQPRACGRVASYELLWCQRFCSLSLLLSYRTHG